MFYKYSTLMSLLPYMHEIKQTCIPHKRENFLHKDISYFYVGKVALGDAGFSLEHFQSTSYANPVNSL